MILKKHKIKQKKTVFFETSKLFNATRKAWVAFETGLGGHYLWRRIVAIVWSVAPDCLDPRHKYSNYADSIVSWDL